MIDKRVLMGWTSKRRCIGTLLCIALCTTAHAALDGFDINSATFPNQYNGDQIWDGSGFLNDWALNGGATTASLFLNGSNLNIANDDNNGWIDQDTGSSPWELGSGSWTIEFSARLDDFTEANDNFVLWSTLEGQRTNITVTAGGVSAGISSTANDLISGVDNTDGFHTYRVAYDSDVGQSWVWRDDVELTRTLGSVADGTDRLIIGDCCTSIGNPIDPFELEYVRYDMTGAYSPVPDTGTVGLAINRETGEMVFSNSTSSPLNILGYSILSDGGALQPAGWTSIADNYDAGSPGPNQVDPDDEWTILSSSSSRTDLSEAELAGGNGATIVSGRSIDLGAAWLQQFSEDVTFEILLADGSILDAAVEFTGNGGSPYSLGDLTGANGTPDGTLDILDWQAFQADYGTDLTGLSSAEAYLASDLDGDGRHTLLDYREFELAYDAVNGAGAFQSLVPEPAGIGMLSFAGLLLFGLRRGKSRSLLAVAFLLAACLLVNNEASAQVLDSTTFEFQYNGSDIFDGTDAVSPWVINGGIEPDDLSLNGTRLLVTPLSGMDDNDNNGWIEQDGGATPWDTAGTGIVDQPRWVLDTSINLNDLDGSVNDNIVLWAEGGGNRQIITITGNSVTTFGGVELDNSDNTDGPHNFQLQFDGTDTTAGPDGTYQLYRDGVHIGVDMARESGQTLSRLIVGDCCTSIGNPVDQYEIGHVRFDVITTGLLTLTVNTVTGAATISNDGSSILDVDSYSIMSDSEALTPGSWSPLANDPAFGNGVPNDGIGFEVISETSSQLAEANLTGSSLFSPDDSVSLGNIFSTGAAEDLVFSIGLEGGGILEANVVYVMDGNNGDFDNNGDWACADIDALVGEIVAGTNNAAFDMNGDGQVNNTDLGVWLAVAGAAELPSGNPYLAGDGNLDGVVDVSDFGIWNGNKFTATGAWCQGDFNADGVTDVSDFGIWNGNKFTSADAAAVPEPGGLSIVIALTLLLGLVGRRSSRMPRRMFFAILLLSIPASLMVSSAEAEVFNDRVYRFGDDSFENASLGAVLGSNIAPPFNDGRTLDSMGNSGAGDFQDLFRDSGNFDNDPVYVDTQSSGRPGAATNGIGVRFDGDGDGLTGRELNSPNDTWADLLGDVDSYPNNWSGIFNRGFQLWVRPEIATGFDTPGIGGGLRQDIVRDTGEHGVYISPNDNWGLQFDDNGIESSVPAVAGEWTHVMQRTISGAFGGALLVDGVAVAARGTFYDPEDGDMSVGANQDLSGNFFRGDIDELRMFVWGDNSAITPNPGEPAGRDWGSIDLGIDNDWIRLELEDMGVTSVADVNLDTMIDDNDVTAFVAGWRSENLVDGVVVGDWNSRQNGDLNYDGIVDLRDAFILHEGLVAATGQGLDFSRLPEPGAGWMICVGFLVTLTRLRRKR